MSLARAIVESAAPSSDTPRTIARCFRELLDAGARLRVAGSASGDAARRLLQDHLPRHCVEVFGTRYYLTNQRFDDHLGFFVGYVVQPDPAGRVRDVFARVFYKDVSLVWRVATHVVRTVDDNWIGKGEVRWHEQDGEQVLCSAEQTADLPFEVQGAFDLVSRRDGKPERDDDAVLLVLRSGPSDRIRPYADFSRPRARARALGEIHGGKPVARFTRRNDPTSLRFARGFEPDFVDGVIDCVSSRSNLYQGDVDKYRIVSRNRLVQYQFAAAPRYVWINPPQALTTTISTYGVRVDDVHAPEELYVPAFEYHFLDEDEDPPRWHSQIPPGFAGAPSLEDPSRADASAWIEKMPVIAEFRATVLARRARGRSVVAQVSETVGARRATRRRGSA